MIARLLAARRHTHTIWRLPVERMGRKAVERERIRSLIPAARFKVVRGRREIPIQDSRNGKGIPTIRVPLSGLLH